MEQTVHKAELVLSVRFQLLVAVAVVEITWLLVVVHVAAVRLVMGLGQIRAEAAAVWGLLDSVLIRRLSM